MLNPSLYVVVKKCSILQTNIWIGDVLSKFYSQVKNSIFLVSPISLEIKTKLLQKNIKIIENKC